jgi:hypothetical protein
MRLALTLAILLAGLPSVARSLDPPTPCPGCYIPAQVTSWQIQFTGTLDLSVEASLYEIDLFDNDARVVTALHTAGRKAICYIDAGTFEDFRPDASAYPDAIKGKRVGGFPDERWLDIRQLSVLQPILTARLDQCVAKGFDGVDFDNVDGYTNDTGFPLTADDQLAFDTWLANAAHARSLSVALKNDLDQIPTLVSYFDWVVDEQCFQYQECDLLQPFIDAGKAVMEIEYRRSPKKFCPTLNAMNFNAMKKRKKLNAKRWSCR